MKIRLTTVGNKHTTHHGLLGSIIRAFEGSKEMYYGKKNHSTFTLSCWSCFLLHGMDDVAFLRTG